jgi:hypothetical protein
MRIWTATACSLAEGPERMEGELKAYVVDYPVNEGSTNEGSISEGSTRALAGSSAESVKELVSMLLTRVT